MSVCGSSVCTGVGGQGGSSLCPCCVSTCVSSGWRGRTCHGAEEGHLRVEGRTAGPRKLNGSQPLLCPLPWVRQTSGAHGHLRCWPGRAAYWVAGHPGAEMVQAFQGALEAIFSGPGCLPNPADYFWRQNIALKDVENFHVRNVWFPFG